jgi:hypothetical protein
MTFAVDKSSDKIRIKQYKYGKNLLDFIITLVDTQKTPPQIEITRSKLRPWRRKELKETIYVNGFKNIKFYGNYELSKLTLSSKDLITLAER